MDARTLPSGRFALWALVLIFLVAAGLRLAYMTQTSPSPLFRTFQIDTQLHAEWIKRLVDGRLTEHRPFFRAPLYPYFAAAIYRLCNSSFSAVRIVQHLMGALTCVLVTMLAGRVFERRTAWVAGGMCALYAPLMYFENELLIPSLIVLLFTATMLAVVAARSRPSTGTWLLGGLLLGLCIIARPNFLLVLPVIVLWWMLLPDARPRRRRLGDCAVLAGGVALCIAPVTLHNGLLGGQWVLIASQGGINFYIGNCADADGKKAFALADSVPNEDKLMDNVFEDSIKVAEQAAGRELNDAQVSNYWFGEGFRFWREQPVEAVSLLVKKVYFLLNGFEIESNRSMYVDRKYSSVFAGLVWVKVIAFPLGLLWPLAIVGMVAPGRRRDLAWLLRSALVVYAASIVAFFVVGRFRMPIVPLLIVFAAHGVVSLISVLRYGPPLRRITHLAAVALLLLLCNSSLFEVRKVDVAHQRFILAYAHRQLGELEEAERLYREALLQRPNYFTYHLHLGMTFARGDRWPEAAEVFGQAAALAPQNSDVLDWLGYALLMSGRPADAEPLLRRAVEQQPDHNTALLHLAMVSVALKKFDAAEKAAQRALTLAPQNAGLHHLLGMVYLKQQRNDLAYERFAEAVRLDAAQSESQLRLGILLDQRGRKTLALSAFDAALQTNPDSFEAHFWRGTVLCELGDLPGGVVSLQEAVRLYPDYAEAHYNLAAAFDLLGDASSARPHLNRAKALGSGIDPALEQRLQQSQPIDDQHPGNDH